MKIIIVVFVAIFGVVNLPAQAGGESAIIPLASVDLKGSFGGVRDGKWIKNDEMPKVFNRQREFVLINISNTSTTESALGSMFEPEIPCEEFNRYDFNKPVDTGVAVGASANWTFYPRKPSKLENNSKIYNEVVSKFLRSKGLNTAKSKITNAFVVDLDGDGTDEVVIAATSYAKGISPSTKSGDYSFVLVRKIAGKKVEEILVVGEFHKKSVEFGAPSTYDISAIADLNGDGVMEVVIVGQYYEGAFSGIYQIEGKNAALKLETGCGV